MADRIKAHFEINTTISALHTYLAEHQPSDPLLREAIDNIRRDLGDLIAEGLKVIRL